MTRGVLLGLALLLAALACPAARCKERPDAAAVINALRKESRSAARMRLARSLLTMGGRRAAAGLAELVREDPSAGVRIEAARALGLVRAEGVIKHLTNLAKIGGPRAARAAVMRALERRDGGIDALRGVLEDHKCSPQDRALLLSGLAWCHSDASREILLGRVGAEDPHLRGIVLRALVTRADDDNARRGVQHRRLVTVPLVLRAVPVPPTSALASGAWPVGSRCAPARHRRLA